MTPQKLRHLCFDKDGTLIDVHAYWAYSSGLRARAIVKEYDLGPSSEELLLRGMGIDPANSRILPGGPIGYEPRPAVIDGTLAALKDMGVRVLAKEINALFVQLDQRQQQENDYKVVALEGVEEALREFHSDGLILSIFSSDRKENSERIIRGLGWASLFTAVIGGGCVANPKPNPEGFHLACRAVNAEPRTSGYVGDTISDMLMAQAAGGYAIGVASGLDTMQDLLRTANAAYPRLNTFQPASPR